MILYSFVSFLTLPFSDFDIFTLVAQTTALRYMLIYVTLNIIASFSVLLH